MNFLSAFGGTQRVALMALGVLMLLIGIVFIVAGSKTVPAIIGTIATKTPVGAAAKVVENAT